MIPANRRGGGATLCAIVKDERPYLLEWVAYHKEIGFDEIVIYSNDCTDGSFELLSALARAGEITHLDVATGKTTGPQAVAYNHLLQTCRTEWVAFLDADEFLVLHMARDVTAFLNGFDEDVSAVAINWRVFGSNGEDAYRPGLVAERFVRAARREDKLNRHIKSFVRAKRADHMLVHAAKLTAGRYVDAAGRPVEVVNTGLIDAVNFEQAQVNHYCVKSKAEFAAKKRRGDATAGSDDPLKYAMRDRQEWFDVHDRNEEEDLSLLRWRDRVRARIGRLNALPGLRATD